MVAVSRSSHVRRMLALTPHQVAATGRCVPCRLNTTKDSYERHPTRNDELTQNIMKFFSFGDLVMPFSGVNFVEDNVVSACPKAGHP